MADPAPNGQNRTKHHPHTYREVSFTTYKDLPPLLYKMRISLAQGPKIENAAEAKEDGKKKLMKVAAIGAALYFAMNFLFPSNPPPAEPGAAPPAAAAPGGE